MIGERELQDMLDALDRITRLSDLTYRERAQVKAAADFIAGARQRLLEDRQTQVCSTCGQVIVPAGLQLPPIKKRILEMVQRRPRIPAAALRELVWADDPNGGPENFKTIHVHIFQLNKLLAPFGLAVRAPQGPRRRIPDSRCVMSGACHRQKGDRVANIEEA
jgi:hypothetical protein